NDAISGANAPGLALVPVGGVAHQRASVAGAVTYGDGGDFFLLGNLTAGTAIALTESQPTTSPLSAVLTIFKGSTAVATSAAGAPSSPYPVPAGGDGTYYVRVSAAGATAGLLAQYLLGIDLVDSVPPTVTAVDLPAEGTSSQAVIDRFTVTFSEDMAA